tara:strand:- start:1397 stop:1573 length:177 start_codon:yes stop_codon:yes gene_type:complete
MRAHIGVGFDQDKTHMVRVELKVRPSTRAYLDNSSVQCAKQFLLSPVNLIAVASLELR